MAGVRLRGLHMGDTARRQARQATAPRLGLQAATGPRQAIMVPRRGMDRLQGTGHRQGTARLHRATVPLQGRHLPMVMVILRLVHTGTMADHCRHLQGQAMGHAATMVATVAGEDEAGLAAGIAAGIAAGRTAARAAGKATARDAIVRAAVRGATTVSKRTTRLVSRR